ncbi:SH3 domain-containing protein [Falsiroseomonas sp.]|uniref:SH3 domain-containing protein n=1 Tax=Falsiroseomonas sp. TaxID=2870721 RepID=UPI0035612EC1
MFSDPARATAFAEAFAALQNALRGQDDAADQDTAPVSVPGAGAGGTLTLPELSSDPFPPTPVWPFVAGAAALAGAAWFMLAPSRDAPRVPGGTPLPFALPPAAAPPAAVASQPVAAAATYPSAAAPLPIERVVTRQGANLRAEPNGSAEVLRTVPASTVLRVFGRSGNWVHVGDREAGGWIHNSLLAVVSPDVV